MHGLHYNIAMKHKITYLFILLAALATLTINVLHTEASKLPPPPALTCPALQAGYVSGEIPATGHTIIHIPYPCPFPSAPVLVVSPAQSEGTLRITQFSANSLDGGNGSIQVYGTPGAVTFSWVATGETVK